MRNRLVKFLLLPYTPHCGIFTPLIQSHLYLLTTLCPHSSIFLSRNHTEELATVTLRNRTLLHTVTYCYHGNTGFSAYLVCRSIHYSCFPRPFRSWRLPSDFIPCGEIIIREEGTEGTSRKTLGGRLGWRLERGPWGRVWCILLANSYCTRFCFVPPSVSWWLTC